MGQICNCADIGNYIFISIEIKHPQKCGSAKHSYNFDLHADTKDMQSVTNTFNSTFEVQGSGLLSQDFTKYLVLKFLVSKQEFFEAKVTVVSGLSQILKIAIITHGLIILNS